MLIRNARVWPPGPPLGTDAAMADLPLSDVRLSGGQVAEHAPRLRPAPGEADIDAAGGTLLPGPASPPGRRISGPPRAWRPGCAPRTRNCRPAPGCAPSATTSQSPGPSTAR